jgi:asparagine synthase (glutamine-hydrolysing)
MCGISGIINTGSGTIGAKAIKAMTDIIKHRGPDDTGYLLVDEKRLIITAGDNDTPAEAYTTVTPYQPKCNISGIPENNFTVALGHRRLSIMDLSPFGHCPLSYKNGRYWITYNGEIYNFKTLRDELVTLGHHFISHADTEVILAAYAEWGTACLQRLQGMWAFAIYDTESEEIFISRDRFGIKPLYYWVNQNNSFSFASEIKQFTVLPGWKATLNNKRAYDYLMYNMTDHTDETMFAGVYHILAGHYFKSSIKNFAAAADGRVKAVRWYDPAYTGSNISFTDAAETFESFFRASVKKHMVADVPVGAALSGGLDSSAVVCELFRIPVQTNATMNVNG